MAVASIALAASKLCVCVVVKAHTARQVSDTVHATKQVSVRNMGFELEMDDEGVKTEVAETAQLLGSSKPEAVDPAGEALKRGRGRPKGAKTKGVDQEDGGGKPAPKKGAKRGALRGEIACMGCKQPFLPDAMSTGGNFCLSCKRALNRLYKIASWEGDKAVQYLKETRANPQAVQALLKHYLAKTGQPAPGKRVKATFSLLTYQESVETATGVEARGRGRLMWRRQYLAFAQSIDGGLKTEEDAMAEWSRMCPFLSGLRKCWSQSTPMTSHRSCLTVSVTLSLL